MAIRITRNEAGNCINFIGSTAPAYWNACLSAEINSEDSNRINIINDIRSQFGAGDQYEFYAVPYTDFSDRDGVAFSSAQDVVDYVNENANVQGLGSTGISLANLDVNFRLDATSTSIIMNTGSSFGVNTIQAVANADNTIHIHAVSPTTPNSGDTANPRKHFEKLDHTRVSIDNTSVSGTLTDVVNSLNAFSSKQEQPQR